MCTSSWATREGLHRPDDDAAIAADQEWPLPGLLQELGDALADEVPREAQVGPVPDRRDHVVG
jgi:hypothetical protein